MTSLQKFAWFNLAVIGLTLIVILSLVPFLGSRALGGLGCLGLIGFSPIFFFRRQPGKVLVDERDNLISWRSQIFSYVLFWVGFVFVAVFLSEVVYGEKGAVPVSVVQLSVAWSFMFLQASASVAILVQYAGGSRDAG